LLDSGYAGFEGAVGAIGLELIVLDEVYAGFGQDLIERKSCFDPIGGKDAIFGRFLMVFCGHVVVLSVVNVVI